MLTRISLPILASSHPSDQPLPYHHTSLGSGSSSSNLLKSVIDLVPLIFVAGVIT